MLVAQTFACAGALRIARVAQATPCAGRAGAASFAKCGLAAMGALTSDEMLDEFNWHVVEMF